MRAASGGLHPIQSTFHRSCARAVQEGSELPAEITHDSSLVCVRFGAEITRFGFVPHSLIDYKVGEQLGRHVTSGATQIR